VRDADWNELTSSIRTSWLAFVYPCLLFAYAGQAAFISNTPSAYSNPFFKSVPPGMLWPGIIISVLAAVVASQAMITSTFQLLSQAINLSYFPNVKVTHTSEVVYGHIYIPLANWFLMVATIIITATFRNVRQGTLWL
jgi:KUP system potassium uptake protein